MRLDRTRQYRFGLADKARTARGAKAWIGTAVVAGHMGIDRDWVDKADSTRRGGAWAVANGNSW
jgi:hypothetical protein